MRLNMKQGTLSIFDEDKWTIALQDDILCEGEWYVTVYLAKVGD